MRGRLRKAMIADLVGPQGMFDTLPQALSAGGASQMPDVVATA
ncbi:hypothetical protein [Bordetella muralis]